MTNSATSIATPDTPGDPDASRFSSFAMSPSLSRTTRFSKTSASRLAPNETRILLGPAGVGKSVLLKLANGLLCPD